LTKVEKLEERLDALAHDGQGPTLTTKEANMVREFWINLHFTPEEGDEYSAIRKRRDDIYAAAGSVYLGAEENREYMKLSKRSTELAHDIVGKRVIANHAMCDRVWPELAPRVLRYWKLREKPVEELTDAEAEEFKGLLEWFGKLQAEALEAAGKGAITSDESTREA
jgi:hypothetical protein